MQLTFDQWKQDLSDARAFQRTHDYVTFIRLSHDAEGEGAPRKAYYYKRAAELIIPDKELSDVQSRAERILSRLNNAQDDKDEPVEKDNVSGAKITAESLIGIIQRLEFLEKQVSGIGASLLPRNVIGLIDGDGDEWEIELMVSLATCVGDTRWTHSSDPGNPEKFYWIVENHGFKGWVFE